MPTKTSRIQLDRTKLLGFKLEPKAAETARGTSAKLGAKFGGKVGGKVGQKPAKKN